jgi:uncharacterized membrane protein YbhN (UPF0104 family)
MDHRNKQKAITWLVSVVIFLTFFCLVFFLQVDYSKPFYADIYSNSFLVSGVVSLTIPLFILIERAGTFDVFNYSFYRWFESFRADQKKRFDSAYDYQSYHEGQRRLSKPFLLPFWVSAGVGLILALVCLLVFRAQIGH